MKKLSFLFATLAVVFSNITCYVIGYMYREMLCGIEHAGYSAPAGVALLYAIPYIAAVIVCVLLAVFFRKKENNNP